MPVSEKQKMWRNNWDKANRCNLACHVYKGYADLVRKVAKENGTTVNAILKAALDKYLEENGEKFTRK